MRTAAEHTKTQERRATRTPLGRAAGAGAETVGAILLLGVVVTTVALFAAGALSQEAEAPTPHVEASGEIRPGGNELLLTRTGGSSVDLGSLGVVAALDGAPWFDVPAGPAGAGWGLGETLRIPLPSGVPADARVDVSLVWRPGSERAAVIGPVDLGGSAGAADAAPLVGPYLDALVGGEDDTLQIKPTQSFLAWARVDHPDGRKLIHHVDALLAGLAAPVRLVDDGTNGDAVAGDGDHGAYITIPVNALPGRYPLLITATDMDGGVSTSLSWIEVVQDAPPALPPPPRPGFSILPGGGVTPHCDGPVRVIVVGTEITYGAGGPDIPVYMAYTQNGGVALVPLFGGRPVLRGDSVEFPDVPAGAVLGLHGRASYRDFDYGYHSYTSDPHVAVLRDGDRAPDVPGFDGQTPIAQYLADYVEGQTITLPPNQVIVLWEFNPSLSSSAADFQDLVVLFEFAPEGCPGVVPGGGALYVPGPHEVPCAELPGSTGWRTLKVEPPRNGVASDGVLSVRVSGFDGKRFDWLSDGGVDAVFVKAGSAGSYLYRYEPEATSGTGLASPGLTGNDISHVSFCYDVG